MREQRSLECSGTRATTPRSFQVVALHWKAAVERDAAHLTIYTSRWLASNGRHFFSPTVRFIGASYKTISILATISATLTRQCPYAKRSRMAAVCAAPFIHMAGLIGSTKVWVHRRWSFSDALDNAAPSDFLTPVSFLLPAALFEIHFYQLGGAGGSKFGIIFMIKCRRNA